MRPLSHFHGRGTVVIVLLLLLHGILQSVDNYAAMKKKYLVCGEILMETLHDINSSLVSKDQRIDGVLWQSAVTIFTSSCYPPLNNTAFEVTTLEPTPVYSGRTEKEASLPVPMHGCLSALSTL